MRRRALGLLALAALAGCGSAETHELPPAAGPANAPKLSAKPAGRTVPPTKVPPSLALDIPPTRATVAGRPAILDPRARTLTLGRERVAAGVGPTHVLAVAHRLYVTDTQGGALLVFATRPKLALTRRVFLPGGPYAIALDATRHRLWVTLTARNEVVSLPANGRPRPLVRLPTVRQPDGIAVSSSTVAVAGRGPNVVQLIGAREAYAEDGG